MKERLSLVTNSSSSSFVISRKDVSKDKLVEILLEIANKEATWLDEDEGYTEDDIRQDEDETCVTYRYRIKEILDNETYVDYDGFEYTDVYYIDNDSCVRYDWNNVEEVLAKYNIPWQHGYCD